jgi:hypothetical protein
VSCAIEVYQSKKTECDTSFQQLLEDFGVVKHLGNDTYLTIHNTIIVVKETDDWDENDD